MRIERTLVFMFILMLVGCVSIAPGAESITISRLVKDQTIYDGKTISVRGCLLYVNGGIEAITQKCPVVLSKDYNRYADNSIDITTDQNLARFSMKMITVKGRFLIYRRTNPDFGINLLGISDLGEIAVISVSN